MAQVPKKAALCVKGVEIITEKSLLKFHTIIPSTIIRLATMSSEGPAVLSFQDTLLRESDVATLSKGGWLNDNIISFYLQYLETKTYNDLNEVALLAAEVVQLIKSLTTADIERMFSHLKSKKLIVLPINDCSISSTGGTHWSLLIYHRGAFFHLDSSSSRNSEDSYLVGGLLSRALFGKKLPITELRCASQRNSNDCGLYVLEFAEIACDLFAKGVPLIEKAFLQVGLSCECSFSLVKHFNYQYTLMKVKTAAW